jgi:modification methylase
MNTENKTKHLVVMGDSRSMTDVKDESVQLVITSPPYWQLKDYGHKEQIGFDDTYENYINNLNLVWDECNRVLSPGCKLCINIGDQFARAIYYGRYKIIPIRTEIIKFCETIGLDYMGAVIWQKVTTTNTTGGASIMGSFPYPRNGILKLDYEFILIFKKPGIAPKPTVEQKEKSKLSIDEWNEYFAGHWNFNGEKQDKHLAMFPEELPKRLIKMFSFVGDTVLDPFLGSGTTSLASMNLLRNSIGYEINPEYTSTIKNKLGFGHSGLLGDNSQITILKQKRHAADFKDKIESLPYIFHDSVKMEKKIDPRQLVFGSKITGKEDSVKSTYRVLQLIDVDLVKLSNGLEVRLLGIEPLPEKKAEAISFLTNLVLNKEVFLRFDDLKHDENNRLFAYVYLKNKTFINAKLIKAGLAVASDKYDFKYMKKFTEYDPLSKREDVLH